MALVSPREAGFPVVLRENPFLRSYWKTSSSGVQPLGWASHTCVGWSTFCKGPLRMTWFPREGRRD